MTTHDARDLNLKINKAELKRLYQTAPFKHGAAIVFNWAIIFGSIYLSTRFFNPILYLLTVIVIGARMHALAILMHDASHFRFLKNRKLSDWITNITTMYPLFSSIEQYRQNHLRHHKHLNTEDDPDWMAKLGRKDFTFPKTKREFLVTVVSYFTLYKGIVDAIWFLRRFSPLKAAAKPANKANKRFGLIFTFLLLVTVSLLGIWLEFALYWLVPYFSTFFMFQYIRSVSEHFGELSYDHMLRSTRTLKSNFIARFLFAPHNVGYHLEHHLYPGVPYYNLPKLHKLLMQDSEYQSNAHITKGFFHGLMNELG